ncbi:MAG: VWA domain-containing protein [Rhodoferax sp.]|nr:VWA domain-containing protein [Rhodoferax sp.]
MTQPTILLSPLKPAIPAQGGAIDIMVRVQGPEQPEGDKAKVTPKRLSLVVDRSGSMSGQPLFEALKCVQHIGSCMTPQDSVSVVLYDDKVNVLMPLGPVTSQDALKRLLSTVQDGGSTNLFGGWEEGAKQLEKAQDSSISRVILLSDGQANHGLVDQAAIEAHCREWLAKGVSTTTVGLGRGFNEDLMIAMAKAGGGQQYYGQTAADLFDSFDEELSLLQALCLRQLSLKLIPAQGVIIEPLGVFDQNADGTYQLSDLAWGAESWLAVRLHISPTAAGQNRDLLAATVQGKTLDGQIVTTHAAMLSLPAMDQTGYQALSVDEDMQRRLQEVEFAKSSLELSRLVNAGDITAARALVKDLEKRFGQHPWLQAKLTRLRELADRDPQMMSKEARFSSRKMSKRLVANFEVAFSGDETDLEIPAFLRKKSEEGKGRRGPGNSSL